MRRVAFAIAALVAAASPAFAAGAYVQRGINDGSGYHVQSYWDESGIGIGPFDPVYQLPSGVSVGGGSGTSGGSGVALPQGVTMTVTNNPVSAGAVITPSQPNSNRKYYTAVNSTSGPCRYGYGSGTTPAVPSATSGMPLQASQSFTLEASVISYQSVSFWCAQAGTIDQTEGQ